MRLKVIALMVITAASTAAAQTSYPDTQSPEQATYVSPYHYSSVLSDPDLIADFSENPRALTNWQNWSLTAYENWQNFEVIQSLDSTWGPYFKPFKAPEDTLNKSTQWLRERLLAAASVLRNTVPYGHHHMNVWNVPDTPQWTDAGYEPGYGIDCSDFTHFIYNYGLGIQLKTGVVEQSEMTTAEMHLFDGSIVQVAGERLFDVQTDYEKDFTTLVASLQPGDLLYIRSDPGLERPISHVIMWLGGLATDENGIDQYLITDSHGDVVIDSNGNVIPSGPEIRPFTEHSYYFGSFDHVIRWAPLNVVPEPSSFALIASAGIVIALGRRLLRKFRGRQSR